jgi:inner membrane protein
MDNLTHSLVGLFLSRAGVNRWSPRATAIVVLAANLPDVDVVSAMGGAPGYLHWHRAWTHSLLAMPLEALVAVALVRVAFRMPLRWRGALAAALLGVGSHVLLDLTNAYGVRVLLPFSSEWIRWDIASIVDPWMLTILLLGILGPFLSRLVGSEISLGGARTRNYGRGGAVFALSVLTMYVGGRAALHARAVSTLESRLYGGAAPLRVAACTAPMNPMRWNGIVETDGFYALAPVDLLREFDPDRSRILEKPDPSPALERARTTPAFRELLRFAQYPMWRVWPDEKIENGTHVEAMDLRFGSPVSPAFFARARLDGNGKVVESSFHFW